MKITISNINQILSDKLSLSERGILITMLLLKEDDPKMTLAKVKAKIKLSNHREDLIHLQDLGLIKWSGYNGATKALEKELITPDVINTIDFMNNLYKRNFKYDTYASSIRQRLTENSVEDIRLVIANRYKEWKNCPVMHVHLNPGTIFRPSKFAKYLEEAQRTRVGESITSASNINLKNGDEITLEISKTFVDSESYNIRVWRLNENGTRAGNGNVGIRLGKNIKMSLNIQKNNLERGDTKEFIYTYIAN